MRYKSSLELNFVPCGTISIFEHIRTYTNTLYHIKAKKRMFFFFYRTRTPLIRVTYFYGFVNRFLKNIFEKILQKSIVICEDVCYN